MQKMILLYIVLISGIEMLCYVNALPFHRSQSATHSSTTSKSIHQKHHLNKPQKNLFNPKENTVLLRWQERKFQPPSLVHKTAAQSGQESNDRYFAQNQKKSLSKMKPHHLLPPMNLSKEEQNILKKDHIQFKTTNNVGEHNRNEVQMNGNHKIIGRCWKRHKHDSTFHPKPNLVFRRKVKRQEKINHTTRSYQQKKDIHQLAEQQLSNWTGNISRKKLKSISEKHVDYKKFILDAIQSSTIQHLPTSEMNELHISKFTVNGGPELATKKQMKRLKSIQQNFLMEKQYTNNNTDETMFEFSTHIPDVNQETTLPFLPVPLFKDIMPQEQTWLTNFIPTNIGVSTENAMQRLNPNNFTMMMMQGITTGTKANDFFYPTLTQGGGNLYSMMPEMLNSHKAPFTLPETSDNSIILPKKDSLRMMVGSFNNGSLMFPKLLNNQVVPSNVDMAPTMIPSDIQVGSDNNNASEPSQNHPIYIQFLPYPHHRLSPLENIQLSYSVSENKHDEGKITTPLPVHELKCGIMKYNGSDSEKAIKVCVMEIPKIISQSKYLYNMSDSYLRKNATYMNKDIQPSLLPSNFESETSNVSTMPTYENTNTDKYDQCHKKITVIKPYKNNPPSRVIHTSIPSDILYLEAETLPSVPEPTLQTEETYTSNLPLNKLKMHLTVPNHQKSVTAFKSRLRAPSQSVLHQQVTALRSTTMNPSHIISKPKHIYKAELHQNVLSDDDIDSKYENITIQSEVERRNVWLSNYA